MERLIVSTKNPHRSIHIEAAFFIVLALLLSAVLSTFFWATKSVSVQGVRKLIAYLLNPFDKETRDAPVMVYIPICPLTSRTITLVRSGMAHIKLSDISALMLRHAIWRFLMSAASEAAGSIIQLVLAQTFSMGDRSKLLPGRKFLCYNTVRTFSTDWLVIPSDDVIA